MRIRGSRGVASTAAIVAGALLFVLACAGRAPSPPPPETSADEREAYGIGVTDVLLISVWRNPELTVEVPVRTDGMISVPLIDDVPAEGLTPQELKEVITREMAEFVAAPDVTVIIRQMNSRYVSVLGEVAMTTRVPLTRNLRVLEVIAQVGGFTPFADRGDIRIVRRQPDGGEIEYRFDYDAYIKGSAPGTNIVLHPGDTIIVPD